MTATVTHVHGPTLIAGCCNLVIYDGVPVAAVLAGSVYADRIEVDGEPAHFVEVGPACRLRSGDCGTENTSVWPSDRTVIVAVDFGPELITTSCPGHPPSRQSESHRYLTVCSHPLIPIPPYPT